MVQLYAPTMGTATHGPPLYTMWFNIGHDSFKGFKADNVTAPDSANMTEQHSLINGHTTVTKCLQDRDPTGALCGCDHGPGSCTSTCTYRQ